MSRNYKNKYFSILGDSVSTFEGYSEPEDAVFYDVSKKLESDILTCTDTWWGRVVEALGGKLLVNNSFSGSTVSFNPLYEIPSYSCSDERTRSLGKDGVLPDVIMVYMGANDRGYGVKIDGGNGDSDKPETFKTAYCLMLEKLRKNYPDAEIWCMTLPKGKCEARSDFKYPVCIDGQHISEFCDAIMCCGEKYGCRVIDLYNLIDSYDAIDGFHPSLDGMRTIADAVLSAVLDNDNDF